MNETPREPPLRVMALHALAYCPRLFYLEEVEQIRLADNRVFAGRELHASLEDEEGGRHETVELTCPKLGLTGKLDCLRRRDGLTIPYEHKRGRCFRADDNTPQPWESDRLQVAAYALMLEEACGETIAEARIRYHTDNIALRVPIDEATRQTVYDTIERAHTLRQSIERPPVAENDRLCARCSLAPVCLPEENRILDDPERKPQRLFPPDYDGATLHIATPGTTVTRSAESLVVKPRDGDPTKHPISGVQAVVLHGAAQITTQAIRLCADRNITVHWVTHGGKHLAAMAATAPQVQRRIRQYRALTDEALCLRLTRSLVLAKLQGQLRFLLRSTRSDSAARQKIETPLQRIRLAIESAAHATNRDSLRGHEGEAAVTYFSTLNTLLNGNVPEELHYGGRSRRPPEDRFNAILSFGYALLQSAVTRAVMAVGLEPALGFYHTPRSAAYPLVLDLMELFRVPLWDMVVVASLNRLQWSPANDFAVTSRKVWLSDSGRKKAIGLFETRLQESWRHPIVDYSLSYARTIELETRLLEKEWTDKPGLFAQLRLR